ncbi:MAG TPA: hypothetical protein PLZ15_03965 [Melioribacteraceae bacterium]|nr:hypothetical protein [Melioribacteraceae bacterium]
MKNKILNLIKHLEKLSAETKPLWGKMTPRHMIEHLILAVRMGNGSLIVECFNPEEKISTLKKFLMSSRPLPKNFINPLIGEDLLPLEYGSIEEALSVLKQEVDKHYRFFELNPDATTTNATFGDLNKDEWEIFHRKHFQHHLEQFGIAIDNE